MRRGVSGCSCVIKGCFLLLESVEKIAELVGTVTEVVPARASCYFEKHFGFSSDFRQSTNFDDTRMDIVANRKRNRCLVLLKFYHL